MPQPTAHDMLESEALQSCSVWPETLCFGRYKHWSSSLPMALGRRHLLLVGITFAIMQAVPRAASFSRAPQWSIASCHICPKATCVASNRYINLEVGTRTEVPTFPTSYVSSLSTSACMSMPQGLKYGVFCWKRSSLPSKSPLPCVLRSTTSPVGGEGEFQDDANVVEPSFKAPGEPDGTENAGSITAKSTKKSFVSKLKFWKQDVNEDGLTTRQRLAKMGLSALLSYGFVSNISYGISLSLAWYGFSKKTGLSPLADGQWPAFLAVYAGFWAFNNVVRPARFALAVAVTPYFNRSIELVQSKTKCSKPVAIGIIVFLANVCGTIGLMALGVSLASVASGVAVFPPKT